MLPSVSLDQYIWIDAPHRVPWRGSCLEGDVRVNVESRWAWRWAWRRATRSNLSL